MSDEHNPFARLAKEPLVPWNGPPPDAPAKPGTRDVLAMDGELVAFAEELEGEVTPEYEARLAEYERASEDLLERLTHARAAELTRSVYRKERAVVCRELARGHDIAVARIEKLTRLVMDRRGLTKVELPDGQIRQGRWRVEAHPDASVDSLPAEFVRTKTTETRKPDKVKMGKAMEQGKKFTGWERVRGLSFV